MSKTGLITYSPTAAMRIICIVIASHELARFFRYDVATGQIFPLFTMDRLEGRDSGSIRAARARTAKAVAGGSRRTTTSASHQASHGRSAQQARKLTPVLPAIPG